MYGQPQKWVQFNKFAFEKIDDQLWFLQVPSPIHVPKIRRGLWDQCKELFGEHSNLLGGESHLLQRTQEDKRFFTWWFLIFVIFTPIWGRFPIWRAYFSDGLVQPPTSTVSFCPKTKGVFVGIPTKWGFTNPKETCSERTKSQRFFSSQPSSMGLIWFLVRIMHDFNVDN